MKKIYIFGTGKNLATVLQSINKDKAEIVGYLDNDVKKVGSIIDKIPVLAPKEMDRNIDYIVISVSVEQNEIRDQLYGLGIPQARILSYFDIQDDNFNTNIDFINYFIRMDELYKRKYLPMISNMEFEVADKIRNNMYEFPIIRSAWEALKLLSKGNKSMCRLGDGEFEIIFNHQRCCYQNTDEILGKRLYEILRNKREHIITCIADNYGNLEEFTDDAANNIRKYMSKETRGNHYAVIDFEKVYYDAYVSRPYILKQNIDYAIQIFELWKEVWDAREVVIVEGIKCRCGYGNDLFRNAKMVERVLCPAENAWRKYDEILKYIRENVSKKKLIMIALGPTATVLAYDLSESGYQAIDMGHLDVEYEWFLRQTRRRVNLKNKYVAEIGSNGFDVEMVTDEEYIKQVLIEIN